MALNLAASGEACPGVESSERHDAAPLRQRRRLPVTAVVVLYHPDAAAIREGILARLGGAVDIVLVDNTPAEDASPADWSPARYIPLGRNTGIARAQNVGIEAARRAGSDYVLLLDQDNVMDVDTVASLVASFERLERQGHAPAVVAPVAVDTETGRVFRPLSHDIEGRFAAVADAHAAGSLLSLNAIEAVGPMREALFIDLVDQDWCWRAGARGFGIFVDGEARVAQTLGRRTRFVLGRRFAEPAEERWYYIVRNALFLLRQPYAPWVWKGGFFLSLPLKVAAFLLLYRRRRVFLRSLLRGFAEGWRLPA